MRRYLSCLAWFLLLSGGLGAQGLVVEPGVGLIDGVQADSFWPADPGQMEPRDCIGCYVHLRPEYDSRVEIVLPCCEWHLPPRCHELFLVWLEQGSEVSRQGGLMSGSCKPGVAKRGNAVVAEMRPAGRVQLAEDLILKPEESYRAISSSSNAFTRLSYVTDTAHEGMLLPTGPVIGMIFSEKNKPGEYIAVSKPSPLKKGETVVLKPLPPAKGWADLTLKLTGDTELLKKAVVRVTDESGTVHEPGFSAGRGRWSFLVFYHLPPGSLTIRVGGGAWAEPEVVAAQGGQVVNAEIAVQPLPTLDISYKVPEDLCEKTTIRVSELRSAREIGTRSVAGETGNEIFNNCPAEQLSVELDCDSRIFKVVEDLSDGQSRKVHLEPEYFTIRGTLYEDDEPAAGTIQFDGSSAWIETKTDDDGAYSCMLFNPVATLRARTDERNDWRFFGLSPPISEDTEKDVFLPGGVGTVKVLDSASRQPIAGADVQYRVKDKYGSLAHTRTTDGEGVIHLPPMYEGEIDLIVRAEGYRDEKTTLQVLGDGKDEFVVDLDKEETRAVLQFLLASGAPAAGATVVLSDRSGGMPMWNGQAGPDGKLGLPDLPASILFSYHPQSGVYAQPLQWPEEGETLRLSLPPVAPPLSVRFLSESGEAVAGALYVISVNGLVVNRAVRAMLRADGLPMRADEFGIVRLRGLPARPVGILGWDRMDPIATRNALMGFSNSNFTMLPLQGGAVDVTILSGAN